MPEIFHRRKAALVAEAGDEADAEVEAVDVVVEAEDVGLDGAGITGAYGGTGADVADTAVAGNPAFRRPLELHRRRWRCGSGLN